MIKMKRQHLKMIKMIAGGILLCLMAAFLVWVNISEMQKGSATDRTIAGSTYRDMTYFSNFSLKTFDGKSFSNEDFKGYDVIIVNVWEPGCKSCLQEMPELDELAAEYKAKGILLIGIQGNAHVYPEDVETGIQEMKDLQISMTQLLADETFSDEVLPYLHNSFPGTWVLDAQGNVLDFTASTKSKADWQAYLDQYVTQEQTST